MKKILIVSNNPLSKVQHNAKTLLSLLGYTDDFSLRQLFFKDGIPDYPSCKYFRITDKDMLGTIFNRTRRAGNEIAARIDNNCLGEVANAASNSNLARLVREIIWKRGKVDFQKLFRWIDEFKPDIVFFMGGDCVFAYQIVKAINDYIQKNKLVLFLTDDYILPRISISLPFWIRRHMLIKAMKDCIHQADLFITISEKMRDIYGTLFHKKSSIYANIPDDSMIRRGRNLHENKSLTFVYTGGLHYNRWKTLSKLASAIALYNKSFGGNAFLSIYSQQMPSVKIKKKLCVENASEFRGALSAEQVETVLSQSDVTVHAESFDLSCIEATKLSFSTKTYEYMSQKKCLLAIGPSTIASMEYLKSCALCINDPAKLDCALIKTLEDEQYRAKIAKACFEKYCEVFHGPESKNAIKNQILNL